MLKKIQIVCTSAAFLGYAHMSAADFVDESVPIVLCI